MLSFFLSCTFQEVIHKQFKNSFIIIPPASSKQSFPPFPSWDMTEIKLRLPWATLAVELLAGGHATVQGHSNLPLHVGWVMARRSRSLQKG